MCKLSIYTKTNYIVINNKYIIIGISYDNIVKGELIYVI